jgi:hypothetical protein
MSLTFQGGFVGKTCSIQSLSSTVSGDKDWIRLARIFPEDVNRAQMFDIISPTENSDTIRGGVAKLKFVFEESSDLFGRIVVYDLRVWGDVIVS